MKNASQFLNLFPYFVCNGFQTHGCPSVRQLRAEKSIACSSDLRTFQFSARPPLFAGFPEGYKVIHFPESIPDACGHRWRTREVYDEF